MSGSIRGFRYLTDSGETLSVNRDESNTELVNAPVITQSGVGGLKKLYSGYRPRAVVLENSERTIKRTCVVLTQTAYNLITQSQNYLATAANFSGVSEDTPLFVTQKIPERITRQPVSFDSGLNDGDNP